jgi:deoxyribodipyrimidine photo-lyase
MLEEVAIWWIRRDLRLEDNQTLMAAVESGFPVVPVFIFDREILEGLEPHDHRIEFLIREVNQLGSGIFKTGSILEVFTGEPFDVFKSLSKRFIIRAVYAGRDYEPYSISRDERVRAFLSAHGAGFFLHDDHMILPPGTIVKSDGTPYTIFTPYKNRWLDYFVNRIPGIAPSADKLSALYKSTGRYAEVKEIEGFIRHSFDFPSRNPDEYLIAQYDKTRDIPSFKGTSRLGIHLRFGTISPRILAIKAFKLNQTYLNELIWREFYQMILYFYPRVVTRSFKPQYDQIEWLNRDQDIASWSAGKTGFPLVDAGIRELVQTGFMHNRIRMVTASFLTKHLLVDWRVGEAFFAKHLLDYELASNNGGWQWAAGTGCDAAPYFRVFNPDLQTKKFDPEHLYIKQWVPEYESPWDYATPIVDHTFARERALKTYAKALKNE